jgi:elongation factor P--beta-lysine ligase
MVVQNSPRQFLAKIRKFFDDNNVCKRHRLQAAYTMLTYACKVAYATAYTGSTQNKTSRLNLVTGHLGCPEKVARPESSCEFLPSPL